MILTVSGLRGIVGEDLSPQYLVKTALGFSELIDRGSCAIGMDTRRSSPMIMNILGSALLSQGCLLYDLGITSTPAIFRKVMKDGLDGGISITASHNPIQWNGAKFVLRSGRGPFEDDLDRLKELMRLSFQRSWNLKGRIIQNDTASYIDDVVNFVGKGSANGLKISIDSGGGSASIFAPELFKALGCRVFSVNAVPGVFSRIIDPTVDELSSLSKSVVVNECKVGFAYDSDADRVVVVDEYGRRLSADKTLLICLKYLHQLNRLGDFVVSVDTSRAVEELAEGFGVRVYRSKVGEANVVQRMLEKGCLVGGEGSSGGVIISSFSLCRDGILASALIARMVAENRNLKDILDDLPRYYQVRRRLVCERARGTSIVEELARRYPDADTLDGLKISMNDDSWVLIRASGTENSLRISSEATNVKRAKYLVDTYIEQIRSIMKNLDQS